MLPLLVSSPDNMACIHWQGPLLLVPVVTAGALKLLDGSRVIKSPDLFTVAEL